jgi:hypothetical protein
VALGGAARGHRNLKAPPLFLGGPRIVRKEDATSSPNGLTDFSRETKRNADKLPKAY